MCKHFQYIIIVIIITIITARVLIDYLKLVSIKKKHSVNKYKYFSSILSYRSFKMNAENNGVVYEILLHRLILKPFVLDFIFYLM